MMGSPVKMMKWLKESAVSSEKLAKLPPEDLKGKFTIGILTDVDKPSYLEKYQQMCKDIKLQPRL